MKKYLVSLLCINLLTMPAYCFEDFLVETLDKNLSIPVGQSVSYSDELSDKLDKSLKPCLKSKVVLVDDFAEQNTAKNQITNLKVDLSEVLPSCAKKDLSSYKKRVITDKSELQRVCVRIKKTISTHGKIDEGDFVEFETIQDVVINKKSYPKGSIVKARIETISQNKCWGVPADIVVGNFTIGEHNLYGEISKTGANRMLWVRPCSIILTPLFGLGLLFIPIRGGHARITPSKIYTFHVID